MYAAYYPVKNPQNPGSAWNQQCQFFSDTRDDPSPNPRALCAEDPCGSISTRMTAGDSVILGIDRKEDIITDALALKVKDLGLIDSILSLHSASSPPVTFNRNTTRTPINALWVSPNIGVLREGYCSFGGSHGMRSDHHQLWIEVDNSTILGKHLSSSFPTPCSKLSSDNPRLRNKYTKLVHQEYSTKLCVPTTVHSIHKILH